MCDSQVLALLRRIDERLVRIEEALGSSSPTAIRPERAYSRAEAARLLGVSATTIDRARQGGLLTEARKLGKRYVRITGESLREFQKENEADVIRMLGS